MILDRVTLLPTSLRRPIAGFALVLLVTLVACEGTTASGLPGGAPAAGSASPVTETVPPPRAASPSPAIGAASPATLAASPGTANPARLQAGEAPVTATIDSPDRLALAAGGGAHTVVRVVNRSDGRRIVQGQVDLVRVPGPHAAPVNRAEARGSCTDCQTFAIALQISLISRDATQITPVNSAVALNVGCVRCRTVARAIQFVQQVDDPTEVPKEAAELARKLERELDGIRRAGDLSTAEAEARIESVIARFRGMAAMLDDRRDEADDSSPTPSPAASPSPALGPTGPLTGTVPPAG